MLGQSRLSAVCLQLLMVGVFSLLTMQCSQAIEVTLDYTYDSSNFFGAGNPSGAAAGAQAKSTLESVADFYSTILTDTFSEIRTPEPFISNRPTGGTVTWSWQVALTHPGTGSNVSIVDPVIAEDEYRIYVGSRILPGNTLGVGGPGGYGWSSNPSGLFTTGELGQINQITSDFSEAVDARGETSGFARWGGALSFDTSANWHYDDATLPGFSENDFLSVAVHEIGHALGLGTSDEWNALAPGNTFNGPKAESVYGSYPPVECVGCGHWANGTQSVILGTSIIQEAALDPSILTGTRKRLTALDAAALDDIGWTVVTPTFDPADYDLDGDVDGNDLATLESWYGVNDNADADGDGDTDGADFLVWQQQYTGASALISTLNVPEPCTIWLLSAGLLLTGCKRRSRCA